MKEQDGMMSNYTTFDELINPLNNQIETIEANRKVHHRETLGFRAFVRLLVYYFVTPSESGRQLLTDVLSAAPELVLTSVKRSTFFDAFKRFPVVWFQQLLGTVLAATQWVSIPELDALGKLYCIDGSIFPALANMVWATYNKNCQAVKLHLCFELNRMVAVEFLLEAGNSSERDALRQMLTAGVTYIADRGYVCFTLLAEIVAAQAHFVMRMKSNLVYTVVENLTVELPLGVQSLFLDVCDQRVCLTNADGKPIYRLVTFSVAEQSYLILTDRLNLTTFQVILLYAYRWQIELMFRFLKRSLSGLHFLSTSKEGLTIQFYMLLVTALLQLRLKQRCLTTLEQATSSSSDSPSCASIADTMAQPDFARSSRGQSFLATVGSQLQHYWKISVHWLISLRNCLARPFDPFVLRLLANT